MKKLISALALLSLVYLAAPAMAGAPNPHDTAAMIKLSQIEARKSMLSLCGVSDEEAADKYLVKDNEEAVKLEASLSEAGKNSLAETRAKIDTGVKTSWDTTPEDKRTKSCEALKTLLSK